ncbi:hypothetical protein CEXT_17181 [Caerostris extrusa]|uniref:Uncharacterized protein n=1 Tax=Caerostris extrusa TaxID=172846 RepID=A0AAV4S2Y0_CAEEX|nr:hypothetical protein CEXT_17181 [Caerostris extrusa]
MDSNESLVVGRPVHHALRAVQVVGSSDRGRAVPGHGPYVLRRVVGAVPRHVMPSAGAQSIHAPHRRWPHGVVDAGAVPGSCRVPSARFGSLLQRIVLVGRVRVLGLVPAGTLRGLAPQHGLISEGGGRPKGQLLLPAQIQAVPAVVGGAEGPAAVQVPRAQRPGDAPAAAAVGAGPGLVVRLSVQVNEVVHHLLPPGGVLLVETPLQVRLEPLLHQVAPA